MFTPPPIIARLGDTGPEDGRTGLGGMEDAATRRPASRTGVQHRVHPPELHRCHGVRTRPLRGIGRRRGWVRAVIRRAHFYA
eukprot:6181593-Pleurochrysis_carterae.AAC.2